LLVALVRDDRIFALVAIFTVETVFALGTVGIFNAIAAEFLVALVTYEHIYTFETDGLVTLFTAEGIFAVVTGPLVAQFAEVEVFALEAECFGALVTVAYIITDAHITAVVAQCLVALVTDEEHIFALKTDGRLTIFTADSDAAVELIAVNAEYLGTLATSVVAAVVADLLVALLTDESIFAVKTGGLATIFTVERIFALTTECRLAHIATFEVFALVAECLVALGT
jgi:hypothetical protein